MKRKWFGLIFWLALVFAAALTGVFVSTDGWYAELNKPAWNPPDWIFGPVWTVLYIMMAVAAWRVWLRGGWNVQCKPLALFLVQWVLNALWTPLFFGFDLAGWALVDVLVLLAFILLTIKAFRPVDRVAACLMVPYAVWVAFASVLNFTIWRLN